MAPTEPPSGVLLGRSGRNRSLGRAFALLERLAAHPGGASVAVLARELELPRATVTRLLGSLADHGAVARTDAGRRWVLGPTIARLAGGAGPAIAVRARARPLLAEAAAALGETVMLAVPTGRAAAEVVEEAAGPRVVGVGSWLGRTLDSPASGFVRMLLAELPAAEARELLARLPLEPRTPATLTDPEAVLAAVQRVRDAGVAVVVDEYEVGLAGMAVPVRSSGRLAAMIGMYVPTARFGREERRAGATVLGDAARRLEEALGG
jgi:IclR family acetate operon transcriptional repressor